MSKVSEIPKRGLMELVQNMVAHSGVARGAKNLWARHFSGPEKTMHFWKVHYLASIAWGGVYPDAWA